MAKFYQKRVRVSVTCHNMGGAIVAPDGARFAEQVKARCEDPRIKKHGVVYLDHAYAETLMAALGVSERVATSLIAKGDGFALIPEDNAWALFALAL